jgi:hypothetical protein
MICAKIVVLDKNTVCWSANAQSKPVKLSWHQERKLWILVKKERKTCAKSVSTKKTQTARTNYVLLAVLFKQSVLIVLPMT